MNELVRFARKNFFLTVIVLSFVTSALVGGTFGYYAAISLVSENGLSIGQLVSRPINGISKAVSGTPRSEEEQVVAVVKKSSPAVVSIVATKDLTYVEQGWTNPFQNFCSDPFFRQFLGGQCDIESTPPKRWTENKQVGAGTGFIVSSDGYILTNKHVVNIAGANFTVITSDNKKYSGKVIAEDPFQDLAILKIDARNSPALHLGDSSKLQIGQTVIAIGNALGEFSNTVSKGVVSGLSRSITAGGSDFSEKLDEVIQTDAAINPGNSGGPLLNLDGEVIGVNTAIVQGAQNIGFTIPINQAKRDINQVKSLGKISYPYIGIRYLVINDSVKEKNNLSVSYGALIIRGNGENELAVMPGSPADRAGLKENDIILEVNGKKIQADNDIAKILQTLNVGGTIALKVLSQGQNKNLSLVLGERN